MPCSTENELSLTAIIPDSVSWRGSYYSRTPNQGSDQLQTGQDDDEDGVQGDFYYTRVTHIVYTLTTINAWSLANVNITINLICFYYYYCLLFVLLGKVSKTLEQFDVEERPSSVLEEKFPNLTVIHSAVKSLHTQSHASSCSAKKYCYYCYYYFLNIKCSHRMMFFAW